MWNNFSRDIAENDKFAKKGDEVVLKTVILDGSGGQITGFGGTQPATTITEYEITLTTAGTVYSQALPANTKHIIFHLLSRGYDLFYSFNNSVFLSIPVGASFELSGINFTGKTLYFRVDDAAGEIVKLQVFS